jgi:hypothetical protein
VVSNLLLVPECIADLYPRAMNDIDGPFMARYIYTHIFRDGALDMDTVPLAVDNAVMALRELGVPASRWATYAHIGV